MANPTTCSVAVCDRRARANGLCKAHNNRRERTGSPGTTAIRRRPQDEFATLFDYIMSLVVPDGDCLVLRQHISDKGYGRIQWEGKLRLAHRVVAEHHLGPAPADGPFVLHSCDNPPCVKISHLRYGTQAENVTDRVNRRGQ